MELFLILLLPHPPKQANKQKEKGADEYLFVYIF